jgi:hypothetical protein
MESLKAQLVGVVNDTMQPASITLWVSEPRIAVAKEQGQQ